MKHGRKEMHPAETVEKINIRPAVSASVPWQLASCTYVPSTTHLNLVRLSRPGKHFRVGDISEKQRYRNIKA